jgi:AraC-like DNA-binding protein
MSVLRDNPRVPPHRLRRYESMHPDERLDARTVASLLQAAEELSCDPALGLKAGMATALGDYDVLEYMALSCPTLGDALDVVCRYLELISGPTACSVERVDEWAVLRIGSRLPSSRAASDFRVATMHRVGSNWLGAELRCQVWLEQDPPRERAAYEAAFPGSRVMFGQPCTGLAWPAASLDAPLRTAEPKLHEVLRRYAERLLAELDRDTTFRHRVRTLLIESLPQGSGTADGIAARLHMSRRTLLRKLEREGTTFKDLVDTTRRQLAMHHLAIGELGASEIAPLLGFAQPSAFHRAFKRWTGTTPLNYRREVGGRPSGLQLAEVG